MYMEKFPSPDEEKQPWEGSAEKKESGFYEVDSDFDKESILNDLEERGYALVFYAVSEGNFAIHLTNHPYGHIELKTKYGTDLDHGGRVDVDRKGLMEIKAVSGTFPETPQGEVREIAKAISSYFKETGIEIESIKYL